MNPEIKEDLMEALRSGEHVQGYEYLEQLDGSQCCLGVLCDIMGAESTVCIRSVRYDGMMSYPSAKIQREAGLTTKDIASLAHLNDEHKATFDEIADWIEVYL